MPTATATETVGEIVARTPAAARVFERHAIDYCCGGGVPLEQACRARGVSLEQILGELDELAVHRWESDDADWAAMSATKLADHIESTHHAWLRQELPRVRELVDAVVRAHGSHTPALRELAQIFYAFEAELSMHMLKEERVLFPAIRALESGSQSAMCCPIDQPVRAMMEEHEHSGAALERMRSLTDGFTPPATACNTHRVMLDALAALERDTHLHVHKENNILFPKARQLAAV